MIVWMVSAGRVRAAGLDIAYDRAGDGPPLVLVHSAASDAGVPPADHRPSRRLHGHRVGRAGSRSVLNVPENFGLTGYATALAALVETLRTPAHVCGLSWGGTV
jgi:pimeloyl-ACP methyl ester carboxylesterase